jgi:hypothetical protein
MAASTDAQVAQLYVALFGRAPDADGLAYWAGRLDSGESFSHIADAMYATTPARTYFPDGATDSQVISSFYENVLGRTGDLAGLEYWREKLGIAGATRGSVIAEMIDVVTHYTGTDPAGITSAQLFANRSAAAIFYGEHGGSVDNATHVLSGITTDAQTLLPARVLVENTVSGTVNVGGFTDVTLGTLAGNVTLTNVVDTAALHFGDTSHAVTLVSFNPVWMGSSLSITLPEGELAPNSTSHLPNYSDFTLIGFNELKVTSTTEAAQVMYLRNEHLDSITITGSGNVSMLDPSGVDFGSLDSPTVDATGFTGTLDIALSPGAVLVAGPGADQVWGSSSTGATVEGGAGNDLVGGFGTVTLVGGSGRDEFVPGTLAGASSATIADFQKGTDAIYLYQVATNHATAVNFVISSYGTWYSQKISLASDATYDAYLNAATGTHSPAAQYAAISWFQYGSDTYLVVDNSSAATFQQNADYVVKLVGQIDLSTLAYDTHTSVLS